MQPTYFINHGGGPCFFIEPPAFFRTAFWELEGYLKGFYAQLPERPKSILIISGHWEEAAPTVNAAAAPPLLYDYNGFPAYTYQLTYPAPGSPDLAMRVCNLLSEAGILCAENTVRGWDHGVFVPLKVMFPDADTPVVQLSMQHGYDPATHLAIGRALTPLRHEGVLIVGSGQTYHNMGGFQSGGGQTDAAAEAFDLWLRERLLDGATRDQALIEWAQAPGARQSQPEEDHLLPLMVTAGAATGEAGQVAFHGHALGKPISGFRFG